MTRTIIPAEIWRICFEEAGR